MGARSARIELPTSAGGWLLSINDLGACIEVDGWSCYTSGTTAAPSEGLFVGHRGFELPLAESPRFAVALDTAISLGYARSELRETGVWKVEHIRDQVFVHGPLIENTTATANAVRAGRVELPWLGMVELSESLASLLPPCADPIG